MKRKKKKVKLKRSFRAIIVLVLALVLGFLSWDFFKDSFHKPLPVEPEEEVKEPEQYILRVFMVGDSLIHWGVYNDAHQSDGSYDFRPMLQYMKPIVSKYEIAYYNQETVLGGTALGVSSYPRFNSPQEVGDAFLDAGFNTVSLATNHTMDMGERGVLSSVEYWKGYPFVATSGQWASEEERTASVSKVYEINHIKYAFISYTIWNNGLRTPYGKEYLNNEYSDEKAAADIALVRDKVDFVIVAMHWGTEYSFKVDNRQEEIANYLSSLGVDLIIGAHPHVIQTVGYINEGKTFVVYSLGNFLSDQLDVDNYTGLAMEVTLKKYIDVDDTVTTSVIEPKAEILYCATNQRGGVSHDFRIMPYPMLSDDQLPNRWNLYEKYKAIVNERCPELVWGLTWE